MEIESEGLPKQIVRKFQISDMIPPMPSFGEMLIAVVKVEPPTSKCATPGCNNVAGLMRGGGMRMSICRPCRSKELAPAMAARKEREKKRMAGLCCEIGCDKKRFISATGRMMPRCKNHQAEYKKAANQEARRKERQ